MLFRVGIPSYFDEDVPSFLYFSIEQAVDWVVAQTQAMSQPYLGYIHLLPPHQPHTTRTEFNDIFIDDFKPPTKPTHPLSNGLDQETLDLLRRYYDEAILYVDAEFARLYDLLDSSGVLNNTWLIFTSDHGELFERGTYSHMTPLLYEPLLHIPLLIWRPGQTRRQDIHTLTSNIDLLPTIYQDCPGAGPGVERRSGLSGPGHAGDDVRERGAGRSIYALEAGGASRNNPLRKATVVLIRDEYKLIYYTGYADIETEYELYDVVNDPEELNDLYTPENPIAKEMIDELDSQLAKAE